MSNFSVYKAALPMVPKGAIAFMDGADCPILWTYNEHARLTAEHAGLELLDEGPEHPFECSVVLRREEATGVFAKLIQAGFKVALISFNAQLGLEVEEDGD